MSIVWKQDDSDTFAAVLNVHAATFTGFDFFGWYGNGEQITPPPVNGSAVSVFGRVVSGDSTTYRHVPSVYGSAPAIADVTETPVRNTDMQLELFMSGVANRTIYRAVFDQACFALVTQCEIDSQTFDGPNSTDLDTSEFAGFAAVAMTFEAWLS